MFNETVKRAFIDSYTDSEATKLFCERVFEITEPYEEDLGIDICAWNEQDLRRISEKLVGIKQASTHVRIHILKKYAEWCVANGVEGATLKIMDVKTTGLGKIREQMVAGPEMLRRYLDAVFDRESEQTTDSIFRCAYWLAFMGVDKEESVSLKRSAVDVERYELTYSRGRQTLYTESVAAFRSCATLDSFRYKDSWQPRADSSLLLTGIRTQYTVSKLKVAMSSRSKTAYDKGLTKQRLSYERVERSGLYYRMRQREIAGYAVDFRETANDFMGDKQYFTGGGTIESVRGRIISDYLRDYKQWKLAFLI